MLWSGVATAKTCTGRFVNPISDVCWDCLFPISIGPIRMGSASGAPDTSNPESPICFCGSPIPRIGPSLGVWEPARLMDVSRTPWCFPNLGGLTIDPGLPAARGRTGSSGGDGVKGSVWHAHYYKYPLLSWIGVLLDLGCLEGGGLDIAWTSELDPAWLDDELSFLLNPDAALFAIGVEQTEVGLVMPVVVFGDVVGPWDFVGDLRIGIGHHYPLEVETSTKRPGHEPGCGTIADGARRGP